LEAIKSGNLNAVHDISDGGLVITLAEMSIFGNKGADVSLDEFSGSLHEILFSEAQSGVVISCDPGKVQSISHHFKNSGIPVYKIGTVGGSGLTFKDLFSVQISEMNKKYEGAVPNAMEV